MVYDPVKEKRKDKIPYEYIKPIFSDCSPVDMSKNSGAQYDEAKKEFIVTLMGENYIVRYPSGDVFHEDTSEVENYPVKTLILRYLVNAKGVPPAGNYISYREVPGAHIYYSNFYGRCIQRLARTFGNNFPGFEKAMARLKGERTPQGDISFKFKFINNVDMYFIIWKGDEEFSPSANILFDENVSHYFSAEDLAFVGDIAIAALSRLSKE